METKSFGFKLDSLDENGTFAGYLSVFGELDSWGDIVEPGAFKKTLKEQKVFPLLNYHDAEQILGDFEAEEDKKGLFIKASLELGIEKAQEKYLLLKRGILKGLSMGFKTIKDKWEKEIRHLFEVQLWEGSLVTFPANPKALVDSVKSLTSLDDVLKVIEILKIRKSISPECMEILIKARDGFSALIDNSEPHDSTQNDNKPQGDDKSLVHLLSIKQELTKLQKIYGG